MLLTRDLCFRSSSCGGGYHLLGRTRAEFIRRALLKRCTKVGGSVDTVPPQEAAALMTLRRVICTLGINVL